MLDPASPMPLSALLQPPAGFDLDRAVGTTYCLDLGSAFLVPAGLTLAGFGDDPERGPSADAVVLLDTARRHANNIDIFCQAGGISAQESRTLFAYLEPWIHEVVLECGIFHPKVWAIRFRSREGAAHYRLVCLSRNLTGARTWDTAVVLDGEESEDVVDDGLSRFVRSLSRLCRQPLPVDRAGAIDRFADDLSRVRFDPPDGFDSVRLRPLGPGLGGWPFPDKADRLLVVSPFLTADKLDQFSRMTPQTRSATLVSRSESLADGDPRMLQKFGELLVLKTEETDNAEVSDRDEGDFSVWSLNILAEQPGASLRGLHAKLYVADLGKTATVWTGSSNATHPAFEGNVEFLVELTGQKQRVGFEAIMGTSEQPSGLRELLDNFIPPEQRTEKSLEQKLREALDTECRRLASRCFRGVVTVGEEGSFGIELVIDGESAQDGQELASLLEGTAAQVWPLTLGRAAAQAPQVRGDFAVAGFGPVAFESLTAFFAIRAMKSEGDTSVEATFVVNAQMTGMPENRQGRLLESLGKKDFTALLMLSLDPLEVGASATGVDLLTGQWEGPRPQPWRPQPAGLLELLLRALAQEPERLDRVELILRDLAGTEDGLQLLPEGWGDVWQPIWAARRAIS
ncbi:MAG TPA: phospholipase D family protein [Chloroflexota bacterium]|nr:phospholipase D family protein [Chloroflexota bacterium]